MSLTTSVYFQTLMSRGKQSVCVYTQAQAINPLSKQKQKISGNCLKWFTLSLEIRCKRKMPCWIPSIFCQIFLVCQMA